MKTGDYVVCIDTDYTGLKENTIYKVLDERGASVRVNGMAKNAKYLFKRRFRKLPHKINFIYKAAEVYPQWEEIATYFSEDDLKKLVALWKATYPNRHWRGLLKYLQQARDHREREKRAAKKREVMYDNSISKIKHIFDEDMDIGDIIGLAASLYADAKTVSEAKSLSDFIEKFQRSYDD